MMHENDVTDAIDKARAHNASMGIDPHSEDTYEGLASYFAEALTQLADKCVVGVPCKRHFGATHGREAEELRKGIEKILASDLDDFPHALRELLDEVDARDSLTFREATDHER
jgi:hypothetical protein